ncbi:hypothetical protein GCM10027176_86610 [Actinoallomurus bryophytorum]|uniref:Uncharacterized protein n=1 Tax=Actinoallomurus bryophytorum TaxID=1490222 RepID=A0A543CMS2_9ACTN|nr:hypothetical protein [Actinoallomurus bryophytorum]TQL98404.1 hypothetical protein FB559_4027 [Actinoallomurus bryophytorum]
MKKRFIATGLLAGGVALTGLAGSAYAAGATPTAKDTGPVKVTGPAKGHGPVAVACVGKGVHIKGKPEKGTFSVKEPGDLRVPPETGKPLTKVPGSVVPGRTADGKALPAPPPGAAVTKVIREKNRHGGPKLGPVPKGLRCFSVKPGTPGAPPPIPAR